MILYHGSSIEVPKPDLEHSRKKLDFGKGFYTTPIYQQAFRWAERYKVFGSEAFVSAYELDEKAWEDGRVLRFDSYSGEWLDFVSKCRAGKIVDSYDIVMGGVADDRVFETLELYFEGIINDDEAVGRLKYDKPNMQLCFKTARILDDYLKFLWSRKI